MTSMDLSRKPSMILLRSETAMVNWGSEWTGWEGGYFKIVKP